MKHLNNSIEFEKKITGISEEETNIINNACNSIHDSYNGKILTKKDQDSTFYVPISSYFGGELFDLIGLFILDRLGKTYLSDHIGLYRDDGLAINKYKYNQNLKNI